MSRGLKISFYQTVGDKSPVGMFVAIYERMENMTDIRKEVSSTYIATQPASGREAAAAGYPPPSV